MSEQASYSSDVRQERLRPILLAPLLAFLALAVGLGWALFRGDPRIIPSALINKPMPEFELPPVQGRTLGLSSEDLKGEVSLVNVFASRTGADLDGRVAIDWGVYGVPETFVVSADGRIAYKHIGPVTPEVYREKIAPIVEELRK